MSCEDGETRSEEAECDGKICEMKFAIAKFKDGRKVLIDFGRVVYICEQEDYGVSIQFDTGHVLHIDEKSEDVTNIISKLGS